MSYVFILVEHQKGIVSDITFEMLGIGRELADSTSSELVTIFLGNNVKELSDVFGLSNKVLYVNHEALSEVTPEAYVKTLANLCKEIPPSFILVSSNNLHSGIGSLIAQQINFPFVNYCNGISVENNQVTSTSLLYGGKIETRVKPNNNQAVFAISPGAFLAEKGKSTNPAIIEEIAAPDLSQLKVKFKQYLEPIAGDIDITQKDILIAIGRGIQNQDNMEIAEDLAIQIGGTTCASRPVVDQGWLPLTRQVGKSGMIVKPKLFFCAGISGAPEHVEGMKNSKLIISINTDEKAPIFNYSDYGIVIDMLDIFPKLSEEIKKRKGG